MSIRKMMTAGLCTALVAAGSGTALAQQATPTQPGTPSTMAPSTMAPSTMAPSTTTPSTMAPTKMAPGTSGTMAPPATGDSMSKGTMTPDSMGSMSKHSGMGMKHHGKMKGSMAKPDTTMSPSGTAASPQQ
ncbi:hypothetical protein FHR90_000899 [Endobacter medicaginis]|uniref:Pentapeptide MXKDX repeat protein n=1 Tax=Endobacter medicaginis TaxID=1181271 RepID=A0A850NPN6_9PROT|nr:hypothetical protein [Endobacter medicaginis]MBB3173081.1 hypothetical protein [Endobacter medicaginis]MCX5474494.1 hypothetical protein [Endobacter medicaginis]NVN31513.1 hypothetical protein [Endobacter medicaginis]